MEQNARALLSNAVTQARNAAEELIEAHDLFMKSYTTSGQDVDALDDVTRMLFSNARAAAEHMLILGIALSAEV